MIIKKDVTETIGRVMEVLSPENAEFTSTKDMSPLDMFLGSLFKVGKFKTRASVYEAAKKFAIKSDKGVLEQYGTETLKSVSEDYEEALSDVILSVTDFEKNELAYAKQVLMASKVFGLLELSGKSISDLEEDGENFLDKSVWNKLNGEDLSNFPQFIKEYESINEIIGRMDTKFMKNVIKLIDDNEKHKDTILDLLVMADIGAGMINMFTTMSELSNKNSTLKSQSDLRAPDEDEDTDIDEDFWDDTEENLSTKLQKSVFGMKSKVADKIAEKVREMLEDDVTDKLAVNFANLVNGKPLALNKDSDYNIITAAHIIEFYINDDLEQSVKVEVTEALLPIAYAMAIHSIEVNLGDIIDLDKIDDYVCAGQDEDYNYEDLEVNVDQLDISQTIETDYAIGSNIATYYYGVSEKDEFIKLLARKTVPVISYEWAENKLANDYDRTVSVKGIKEILTAEYKNLSDSSSSNIEMAASAIYSAISE